MKALLKFGAFYCVVALLKVTFSRLINSMTQANVGCFVKINGPFSNEPVIYLIPYKRKSLIIPFQFCKPIKRSYIIPDNPTNEQNVFIKLIGIKYRVFIKYERDCIASITCHYVPQSALLNTAATQIKDGDRPAIKFPRSRHKMNECTSQYGRHSFFYSVSQFVVFIKYCKK